MSLPINKQTALEVSDDVRSTLDWKVAQLQEEGLPVETGLADYIALAIQGIDEKIAYLKHCKKTYDEAIKEATNFKEKVAKEVAEYLENMGVEKIKGSVVSSVTIKPESVSIRKTFKWDIDRNEAIEKGLAHYEETLKEVPKAIKINKRKAKDDDK